MIREFKASRWGVTGKVWCECHTAEKTFDADSLFSFSTDAKRLEKAFAKANKWADEIEQVFKKHCVCGSEKMPAQEMKARRDARIDIELAMIRAKYPSKRNSETRSYAEEVKKDNSFATGAAIGAITGSAAVGAAVGLVSGNDPVGAVVGGVVGGAIDNILGD